MILGEADKTLFLTIYYAASPIKIAIFELSVHCSTLLGVYINFKLSDESLELTPKKDAFENIPHFGIIKSIKAFAASLTFFVNLTLVKTFCFTEMYFIFQHFWLGYVLEV
jgi:hypothetical protein